MADVIYLASEVAEKLRVPEATVRRLALAHDIGLRVGSRNGTVRFTESDYEALVEALRAKPAAS